jgi:hypothetical protein
LQGKGKLSLVARSTLSEVYGLSATRSAGKRKWLSSAQLRGCYEEILAKYGDEVRQKIWVEAIE